MSLRAIDSYSLVPSETKTPMRPSGKDVSPLASEEEQAQVLEVMDRLSTHLGATSDRLGRTLSAATLGVLGLLVVRYRFNANSIPLSVAVLANALTDKIRRRDAPYLSLLQAATATRGALSLQVHSSGGAQSLV